MEAQAFGSMLQYGSIPAVIVMIVMIYYLRRDLSEIKKGLENLGVRSDNLSNRMHYIEKSYVERNDYYKDISGWREDIKGITDKLDKYTMELREHEAKSA